MREKSKLGLDSPVQFLMREDPDLSRQDAIDTIMSNQRDYALVIEMVRALNIPSNADAENPGMSPKKNGAMGGPNGTNNDRGGSHQGPPDQGGRLQEIARRVLNAH